MESTQTNESTVVVTGASRGLGAVMAHHLADHGFRVFAGMRHPRPSAHRRIVPVALDVTDRSSIAAAADAVAAHVGPRGLTALVNNAALLEAGPLELADAGQVWRHLATNVEGPLATSQALLPLLRAGRGRIVNVSSVNAQLPLPFWGLYSASKAALVALSDALRVELAPAGVGVTVVTLGAYATDVRRRALTGWPQGNGYDEARNAAAALVSLLDATAAAPAEVGDTVVELLTSAVAPAHRALGEGIEDLLALASQSPEVRDAALAELHAAASAFAGS